MEFHFHKERKKLRLKELCSEYGYEFRESGNKIIVQGQLPKQAGAFMLNWSEVSLLQFLDEYKHWDGHQSKTAIALFSADKEHIEWIKTLGRICGIGGAISVGTSGFGSTIYKLQQNRRQWATGKCVKWTKIKTDGTRVLCPTVPSGWFYVRRQGKICVTGNSNYYGKPFTMARHAKVITRMVEDFQAAYFEAFPGIQQWHRWTAQQLQTKQCITTPWGVTRYFFGRPNDDSTLREAIAFSPQSSTALRMNLAIYNIWQDMGRDIGLLAQVHDAVYFLYREEDELEVVPKALHHINSIRMTHGDRELIVPGEAKIGWNWGNYATEADVTKGRAKHPNLDGMMKFKPGVRDARTRTGLLDRRL
jgi:hypothetical protein